MARVGGRGVGLLGQSGAGACPNLLQRRPGPGSAARRNAESQRFTFGAPARSGPLQQIWTTCAAAGPPGGSPRVPREGHHGSGGGRSRRPDRPGGPTRTSTRGSSSRVAAPGVPRRTAVRERPARPRGSRCLAPGASWHRECISLSRRRFRPLLSRAGRTSRRERGRPHPTRGGSGAPLHSARRSSRMVGQCLACRDAVALLGPLACGWTTYVPLDHRIS